MTSSPSTRLQVRVFPNASRNEVAGYSEGVLRLKIAAPPVKDRANQELVSFLSKKLNTSKDSISVIKGHTSKNKLVAIEGMEQAAVIQKLVPQQEQMF